MMLHDQEADDDLNTALETGNFPSISVAAVVSGGATVLSRACRHGQMVAASETTTIFQAASISKSILGVITMQCVDRSVLDLDADINTYLASSRDASLSVRNPNFPDVPITTRHLLIHASGLRDDESGLVSGNQCRTEGRDHPMSLLNYVRRRLVPGGDLYTKSTWDTAAAPGCARYRPLCKWRPSGGAAEETGKKYSPILSDIILILLIDFLTHTYW